MKHSRGNRITRKWRIYILWIYLDLAMEDPTNKNNAMNNGFTHLSFFITYILRKYCQIYFKKIYCFIWRKYCELYFEKIYCLIWREFIAEYILRRYTVLFEENNGRMISRRASPSLISRRASHNLISKKLE
jgi:hypothetical protein